MTKTELAPAIRMRILIFASTAAAASATKIAVSKTSSSSQKLQSVTQIEVPTISSASTSTASIVSATAVTSGAWATETHSSCSSLDSQPPVVGFNLGSCVGSIAGSSISYKYTSCEWNTDKTTLTINYEYYTSSAFCDSSEGSFNEIVSTKSNLVDGCKNGKLYQCGATVEFADYGSPQHIGNWNAATCGSTADEMEWEIFSYDSCTANAGCTVLSSSYSSKGVCDDTDDTCFHIDTKIDYKGIEYTYEELKAGKEPECTVPHTPFSKGVIISTSCGKTVRVTDTHLIATTKGFQLAYSLKAGDVLFGDYDNELCIVESVEKEKTTQQYFGLNCVHSEVLASGLRASTFGDFHTLPSWYMTYVGGLVGSETASSLGQYISEWYAQ